MNGIYVNDAEILTNTFTTEIDVAENVQKI